jgi:predicted metal-binding membrane protein
VGALRTSWTSSTIAAVVVAAWLALAIWGASPYVGYLGHSEPLHSDVPVVIGAVLFLVGWALMILAMMLPTATLLLGDFALVVRHREDAARLRLLVVAGFLNTWIVVGLAFQVFDIGVHVTVDAVSWLNEHPRVVAASVLAIAGMFQFTTLKRRCLKACRTPRSFIYRHWRGRQPAFDALTVGMAYGVSCVGCCWALMLVLFALGTANLAWMLAAGAVMAVEKNASWGHRISAPLGVALLGASVWALAA